jgi:hypothetical protein
MENEVTPLPQTNTLCAACYSAVTNDDDYCTNCGYPLKGSEKDQQYFISMRKSKEIDLNEANKKIKKAGYILYLIAGLTGIYGIAMFFVNKSAGEGLLIVNLILAIVYSGLGFWSKNKPLASIISGFALYVLIFLLNAIVNPITILSGFLFKIFFVICFVKGIQSALEAEKIKKELNIE